MEGNYLLGLSLRKFCKSIVKKIWKSMETNNYPNWLVSIEQSKKLKRIGFDVECLFFYDDILKEISFDEEDVGLINWNRKDFTKCISLPTWEQVFEWFRERGMFHSIHISDDLLQNVKFFEAEIRDKNADIICILSRLTYEEVREALLNSLIEIYINEEK